MVVSFLIRQGAAAGRAAGGIPSEEHPEGGFAAAEVNERAGPRAQGGTLSDAAVGREELEFEKRRHWKKVKNESNRRCGYLELERERESEREREALEFEKNGK